MPVEFTKDIERRRVLQSREEKPKSWELHSGTNLVQAVRVARDLGWKDKKVQVRKEELEDGTEMYYVEPYEKGCGCKGMLKYQNYFG